MIFVTVGSVLPFDRMIQTMDDWAGRHPEEEVFAQIGNGQYEPRNMSFLRMIKSGDFNGYIARADLVVAHAGTGSVFGAFEYGKPVVLVPRYAAQREHTTDHQVHTANWLRDWPGVTICTKHDNIDEKIVEAKSKKEQLSSFSKFAPNDFILRVREFIMN